MKILTWNCNGGFRKKFAHISGLSSDICIIQECEDPTRVKIASREYRRFSKNHLWVGENKNKGLGVFGREDVTFFQYSLDQSLETTQLKWFLPFRCNNAIDIVATWAHRGDTGEFRYIGQFYKLLVNNIDKIDGKVFVGDFNSNRIWDYKRAEGDHSTCVRILQEKGIHSVYHKLRGEEQGAESQPTFLLQKKFEKPYHIDYIFAPEMYILKTKNFIVDDFRYWRPLSDHVPLVWEFQET